VVEIGGRKNKLDKRLRRCSSGSSSDATIGKNPIRTIATHHRVRYGDAVVTKAVVSANGQLNGVVVQWPGGEGQWTTTPHTDHHTGLAVADRK